MEIERVRAELRQAVRELSERGLYSSSKWCAEQLVGLGCPAATAGPSAPPAPADDGEATDALLLARCYFQMREYLRAAHALEEAPGHTARFLRLYALYLAGERRKDDQTLEESASLADSCPAHVANQQLKPIDAELRGLHERDALDGYALYLYAIVLKQLQRPAHAVDLLCAALHKEPTLWAAWLELAAACADRDAIARLALPEHWMKHFFYAHVCLELQQNSEAVTLYEGLATEFPASTYILAQLATAHYQLREFDEAQVTTRGTRDALARRPPWPSCLPERPRARSSPERASCAACQSYPNDGGAWRADRRTRRATRAPRAGRCALRSCCALTRTASTTSTRTQTSCT